MTFEEIKNKILEISARTGKGSVSIKETFDIINNLLLKTQNVDMNQGNLSVRRVYTSESAMLADNVNPTDYKSGKKLKYGQLVLLITSSGSSIYMFQDPGYVHVKDLGDLTAYATSNDVELQTTLMDGGTA